MRSEKEIMDRYLEAKSGYTSLYNEFERLSKLAKHNYEIGDDFLAVSYEQQAQNVLQSMTRFNEALQMLVWVLNIGGEEK